MKNRKSAASPRRHLRFLPTPRDRLILEVVYTHSRLTSSQIRRLFFGRNSGALASVQAVNARLKKLAMLGYLEPVVVNAGRGAGPYAYGLTPRGRMMLHPSRAARRGSPGPVWHHLEVAEFRIRLQEALESRGGELAEWLGEPAVRSLLVAKRGWPIPDALVHWRLFGREGTFLLEWDRGSESLALLTAKMARYMEYWRARGHKQLLPGLALRPRLAVVLKSRERANRLIGWLLERRGQPSASTILVALADSVLPDPLGAHWWRSDIRVLGTLHE